MEIKLERINPGAVPNYDRYSTDVLVLEGFSPPSALTWLREARDDSRKNVLPPKPSRVPPLTILNLSEEMTEEIRKEFIGLGGHIMDEDELNEMLDYLKKLPPARLDVIRPLSIKPSPEDQRRYSNYGLSDEELKELFRLAQRRDGDLSEDGYF